MTDEEKAQAETAGGYAREMSEDYKRRQAELVHQRAAASDIVITTALIPGRKAPTLIQEDTVKAMKPGSVLVDLAIEQGGNCPLTEYDRVVEKHGVTLVASPTCLRWCAPTRARSTPAMSSTSWACCCPPRAPS